MSDRADLDVLIPPSAEYVLATARLDAKPDRCHELVREATRLAREHGLNRFLFDLSAIKRADSRAQQFEEAQNLGRSGLLRSDRIAVLVAPDSDDHDYIAMLVRDEGYNQRLFRSFEKAKQWLLQDD